MDGGLKDVTEVVRTGLQLAIEHQEGMMTAMPATLVDGSEPL